MNLANSLLPFVSTFRDRHGVLRPRFRRAGYSRYLPLDMEGADFAAAYEECLKEAPPTPIRSPKSAVGQLRALAQRHGWELVGEYVYFVATKRMVKIGFSSSIAERIRNLAGQTPTRLRLLAVLPGGMELERRLQKRFAPYRIKGEWFRFSPEIRQVVNAAVRGGTEVDIG